MNIYSILDNETIYYIYLHVPFCAKKCNYCTFLSYEKKEHLINDYVDALLKEINFLKNRFRIIPKTIYFGGGSPSLLNRNQIKNILSILVHPKTIEVSFEGNPEHLSFSYLRSLREMGINRLSIGAQTFNPRFLDILGRIHTAEKTKGAFYDAKQAGFKNINIDLIYSLPFQTLKDFKKDLEEILLLSPEHISVYNLEIEKGSALFDSSFKDKMPTQEDEASMFEYIISELEKAGYNHYEISNFSKTHPCQHNLSYWKNENYLGMGVGASSHLNGIRWQKTAQVEKYINCANDEMFSEMVDGIECSNIAKDRIFMGLRLLSGVPISYFRKFQGLTKNLIEKGLLEIKEHKIKLTRKGLFLANQVFLEYV